MTDKHTDGRENEPGRSAKVIPLRRSLDRVDRAAERLDRLAGDVGATLAQLVATADAHGIELTDQVRLAAAVLNDPSDHGQALVRRRRAGERTGDRAAEPGFGGLMLTRRDWLLLVAHIAGAAATQQALDADLLTALGELLDPDEGERVAAALSGQTRADAQLVRHLEGLLAHYRTLDDLIGPQRTLISVRALVGAIDHFRRDAPAAEQRALSGLAAQYEQLTGWLWVDSGNHAMASRAYDRAIARATESGQHALARYLLACKSEQALMVGELSTALLLGQEAQAITGDAKGTWRVTDAPLAWAADLEARVLALTGQRHACERRLDEAEALLSRSAEDQRAEEPPWIYHYVPAALAVHRGMCYTDLGLPERAIPVLEAAVASVPEERVRDRAYYLCRTPPRRTCSTATWTRRARLRSRPRTWRCGRTRLGCSRSCARSTPRWVSGRTCQ